MDTKAWTINEATRFHAESVRMLKIAHSRIGSLQKMGKAFGKDALFQKMREARKKLREVQEIIGALPPNLGRAVVGKSQVKMLKKEEAQQLKLFPFGKAA